MNSPLLVPFKDFALVEEAKEMFGLPGASKDRRQRFMNIEIVLRRELARFTRFLGSKSATISSGRLSTPTFSMHKQFELISWAEDPSMEVSNGSIFLDRLAKLELLPQIGLKKSTSTPGVL